MLLAACAATPTQPSPSAPESPATSPVHDTRPAPTAEIDLLTPALRARSGLTEILGRPVPAEASVPLAATRAEMIDALAAELRPQVDMLHPEASPAARETLLRATAEKSARSVVARYSTTRRRILVPLENVVPQMTALGLPTDPSTVHDFTTLVLAHEMVHAVDDAAHPLAALYRSATDAESLRALGMVVEGRAVHYARRVAAHLGIEDAVASVLPGERGTLDEYRARFLLTYREGAAFAASLEERGLADRVLERPPLRTSTVFHPARYSATGEAPVPDLAAALRRAGFETAAATSELDLRARWLPVLGEEDTARAFASFVSGAGIHRDGGGVGASRHETADGAAAYAAGLRVIYGIDDSAAEGTTPGGLRAVVLVAGNATASAVGADAATVRDEAARALDAAR